jgi:hypothetical protein
MQTAYSFTDGSLPDCGSIEIICVVSREKLCGNCISCLSSASHNVSSISLPHLGKANEHSIGHRRHRLASEPGEGELHRACETQSIYGG